MFAPILQYPDLEKEYNIETDDSNVGVGALLSQDHVAST